MMTDIQPQDIQPGDYVRIKLAVKRSIIGFQFKHHNAQVKSRNGNFLTVKARSYKSPQPAMISAVLKAWRYAPETQPSPNQT